MKKALIISKNEALVQSLEPILHEKGYSITSVPQWPDTYQGEAYSFYIADQYAFPSALVQEFLRYANLVVFLYDDHYTTARAWLDAGASAIFLYPGEIEALRQHIAMVETRQINRERSTRGGITAAKVLAFYSAKGGSGKTVIASIVAQMLSARHKKETLLVDLNAQFGGLEALFNLEPQRSYIDLQPVIHELSYYHLNSVTMRNPETGLSILHGPADPDKAVLATEELLVRTIRLARQHYDHVVLDLPSAMNPQSFTGLKEADHIYYVLTPDSLAIRAFKQVKPFFERYNLDKSGYFSLIVNRIHKKSEITVIDIKRILDLPVAATVRANYFALQPFLNMGKPLLTQKKRSFRTKTFEKDLKAFTDAIAKGGFPDGTVLPKLSVKSLEFRGS